MSKFVDARVSRRFTLPSFNPSRGPMLQLQAWPRAFHFDFPSSLSSPRTRRGKKKESFCTNRANAQGFPSFPDFSLSFERDQYTLTLYLVRSSIGPWERNLPFCFLYKFSNTLFQLFVSLHRISSPSPIRFLLASIPERDRLDDLPSMWKQKKKKYRFVRGNESKCCSPAWKKTWYFRSSFRNSRVHCLRRFTPVQRISFDFRPKWSTFSTPSGIVLRKSKNWNRFGNLLP